jgi:hypothetical protein
MIDVPSPVIASSLCLISDSSFAYCTPLIASHTHILPLSVFSLMRVFRMKSTLSSV